MIEPDLSYGRGAPTRPNFVEPAPIQPWRGQTIIEQPADYSQLAPSAPALADVTLRTTYSDRADGFIRATTPLAVVTGLITLVAAVGLFSVPLLSFAALLWLFSGFAVTWLIAYVSHLFISPDGSTWWHTIMLWRIVEREQRFRHERFWTQYYDQQEADE